MSEQTEKIEALVDSLESLTHQAKDIAKKQYDCKTMLALAMAELDAEEFQHGDTLVTYKSKTLWVDGVLDKLKEFLVANNIETLNVAGNRTQKAESVKPILKEALSEKAPVEAPAEQATTEQRKANSDIIGKPKVGRKAQNKLQESAKKAESKQQEQQRRNEELDSLSDEIDDKLNDDLCI